MSSAAGLPCTDVLLAGGTGLVGQAVTDALSRRRDVALTRLARRAAAPGDIVIEFEALAADPSAIGGVGPVTVAISCLGTTRRAAGSPAAFRRIDHDYVLAFARAARAAGARRFILVSSVGAGGRGLYLGVKGEVEAAVAALGFDRLDIVRPGLLIGPRADRRPAERLAQAFAPLLDPLLRGSFARYRSIDAAIVAAAIARLALTAEPGRFVHHGPELRALATIADKEGIRAT